MVTEYCGHYGYRILDDVPASILYLNCSLVALSYVSLDLL